jgi:hypothetical protein
MFHSHDCGGAALDALAAVVTVLLGSFIILLFSSRNRWRKRPGEIAIQFI